MDDGKINIRQWLAIIIVGALFSMCGWCLKTIFAMDQTINLLQDQVSTLKIQYKDQEKEIDNNREEAIRLQDFQTYRENKK